MAFRWGFVAVVLAGCSFPTKHFVPGDAAPEGPPAQYTQRITNDLDLLFVIDNSASTTDKQTAFAQSFPQLVQALDAFPSGRPNLHLGVVDSTVDINSTTSGPGCPSPDLADNGVLQNAPRVAGCVPPTGRFISDVLNGSAGARTTNYSGTLADTFSCIAQVGATGCGYEAQLEGMKRALDGSRSENAGFLRDTSDLAIVMLTDEDDCSAQDTSIFALGSGYGPGDFRCQPMFAYNCDQPISPTTAGTYNNCTPRLDSYLQTPAFYHDFLATVKDPSQVAIAIIGGDPQTQIMTGPITTPFNQTLALLPSCMATINGNPAIGRPGIRLSAVVNQFGTHGMYRSVCQADYTTTLGDIGMFIYSMMRPCIHDPIDTTDRDASNPGLQPACTFVLSSSPQPISFCSMVDATTPAPGTSPCVWFQSDTSCGTPTNLIAHLANITLAGGTTVEISCASSP